MTITLRAGVLNSGIQQNGTEFLTVDTSNNVSLSAALPVLSGGTGVTTKTGTGAVVLGTSPTITGATITVAATAAPAFSAYQSTSTSLTANVTTKILFATEEFDTNNNFASSTFTPTVAGYYQVSGCMGINTAAANLTSFIYKNGAAYKSTTNAPALFQCAVSCLVYCNGSTDYVEFYGTSSTTQGTSIDPLGTWFQAAMVRSA